ncbi:ocs element-binding factor 1-like [Phragmites australis]|uniref:ocs element-binding factor 1-like n=1 Tax=Phragmites australis TaxID=29695 RepID=UPI002D76DCE8|nr:ocs element-binding factor 1-like [Phragmites australis]
MRSPQEARDLDFASSCGARDLDVITFGFTPWGPESCPSLEQVMASTTAAGEEADEEEEQRRQRRKISNRLSAQRSRARKQRRLEEVRATAARLRDEKQVLAAKLQALARHDLVVRCENARLCAEAAALERRLREARSLLALRRLAQLLPQPLPEQAGVAPAASLGLASLMT